MGIFECRVKVKFFLNEMNHSQPLLLNAQEWLWKLAFAEDLTVLLNKVNLLLEGENNAHVKLVLW